MILSSLFVVTFALAAAPPADASDLRRLGLLDRIPATHALNDRTFEIPFVNESSRPVKVLRLYVSTDGKTFRHAATAAPKHGSFVFTADGEGWCYFVIQREGFDGERTPAVVGASAIDLSVRVDLRPPVVSLEGPEGYSRSLRVNWKASDDHALDLSRLTLEYRPVGARCWTALAIRPAARGKFEWTPFESPMTGS